MRILKVIHGYPPAYNAGSEVYSQSLCEALSLNHEVHVFTREENPFVPDYSLREEADSLLKNITKHIVNIPLLRQRYRYSHAIVDSLFGELLDRINPDILHVGHLNHLSTTLVAEAKHRKIPIVYTLHDYWLICARGQFLQRNPHSPSEVWKLCDGQKNRKCAERCYSGYYSGLNHAYATEVSYWEDWFNNRTEHLREVVKHVDLFIAPSRYLQKKYQDYYNLHPDKLIYLDYGFDLKRLQNRHRTSEKRFVFGYIGTHTPQKGVHHLIEAFGLTTRDSQLRIWGRERGEVTPALRLCVNKLSNRHREAIAWMGEYRNENIVRDVFNYIDALVVPSIWEENSPLVIHEAQQARVPVITANMGGMSEYVHHEVNGLLFEFRNVQDLCSQMDFLAGDLEVAQKLGERSYLYSSSGNVPSMTQHVEILENIYRGLVYKRKEKECV